MRHIDQIIHNFKQESRAIKPSNNAVDILKNLMESVEISLSEFKEQHRLQFDEMSNDEKILSKEMEIYEKKIQNWSTTNTEIIGNTKLPVGSGLGLMDKNSENCELLKEVVEFDVSN